MADEELRNLAADFNDLTDSAKQALRQEMQSRGLGDPQVASSANVPALSSRSASTAPMQRQRPGTAFGAEEQPIFPADSVPGYFGVSPKIVRDDESDGEQDDEGGSRDYTWKTVLCECETIEEAQQLVEALQTAGLDGWVQLPREFGRRYAQVVVAADQLEQAQAIAAKPIPQDIIDDSKVKVPEFVAPKCPKCGAEDPILESAEPTNHWHCEQCNADWSDPPEVAAGDPANPVDRPS